MTEMQQSQLDYISKRRNDYNHKYAIASQYIDRFVTEDSKVLELFGGIGIMSWFISKKKPSLHIINDYDLRCYDYLVNRFPNKTITQIDVFTGEHSYGEFDDFDNVFLDCNTFTPKNIDDFKLIFSCFPVDWKGNVFLTETGIFYITHFQKKKTVEEYYESMRVLIRQHFNMELVEVQHWSKFSIMRLSKSKEKLKIIKNIVCDVRWTLYFSKLKIFE